MTHTMNSYHQLILNMPNTTPQFRIHVGGWSNCTQVETRIVQVCDQAHNCINYTSDYNPNQTFYLVRPCEGDSGSGIIAAIVVSIFLLLIIFGCMWQCGCFYRRSRSVAVV